MDIYVGNLPYEIDEKTLREAFQEYGDVGNVKIIEDRETGRAKGFAFITMDDWKEAQKAIKGLDGQDIGGRPARVNEAQQRNNKFQGSGGGGGGNYNKSRRY